MSISRLPALLILQVAVVAAILGANHRWAHAGADCEPNQGWKLLEKLAGGKVSAKSLGDGNNDIDLCILGPMSLTPSQGHWYRKGPKPKAAPTSEQGQKIARLCTPAFADSKRSLAMELCVALLAEVRVSEIAGKQTLALGNEVYQCGFPLKQLWLLPGAASARAAESQWDSEQATFCGYGGCSCSRAPKAKPSKARMRYRRKFLRDHKFDVLNALSWIGDAKSIKWLEKVASNDADSDVRERASKVLSVLRSSP